MLQDARREAHEILRADRDADIAARKARNSPLDDSSDWGALAVKAHQIYAGVEHHDTVRVRELAVDLLAGTAAVRSPVPPYEPDPDLDGIRVRLRVLPERRRRVLSAAIEEPLVRVSANGGDIQKSIEADEEGIAAIAQYVLEAVAAVEGVTTIGADGEQPLASPIDDDALEALRRGGLLSPLFVVARAFQGLPAKKAMRFGQPPPSTSPSGSTAPAAPSASESSSGASAERASPTSRAPDTRPTAALDDTSRTTEETSPMSSPSSAPSASTSGSMGSKS